MATLIDTFVSIFSADTDELRRGHEQARRSTDDIVEGMKAADEQANKTSDSIGRMLTRAAGFLVSAIAAERTLQGVMNRASAINQMNQTAQSIGTAVGQMDAFTRSIQDNGGTAQGAISSIENMYKAMGRASERATSQQAQAFQKMGITLKDAEGNFRDTMDVVLDVAGAMEQLEGAAAEDLAAKLGITDRRTIEVMLRGREELGRMMRAHKEYGVISEETAERAAAFSDALSYLQGGVERAGDRLVHLLLPAITWVTDVLGRLVRWMHDNSDFVTGFFLAIATVVATKFLPVMVSAAGAVLAATWPFLLLAAVILGLSAVFALIYDDIRNFMRGNDSLIGQIAEEYPALGRMIERLGEVVSTIFGAVGDLLDWLSERFGVSFGSIGDVIRAYFRFLFGTLNLVAEWSESFAQFFRDAADDVVGIFKWLWERIQELLKPITGAFNFVTDGISNIGGSVREGISGAANRVRGWFGGDSEDEQNNIYGPEVPVIVAPGVDEANDVLGAAAGEPMNSYTSSMINNSARTQTENNVSVGEINIQTQATDARGVANDIRSELAEQLKQLNAERATGVAR